MQSEIVEYFKYLKNVLGVGQVVMPPGSDSADSAQAQISVEHHPKPKMLVGGELPQTEQEAELFAKMLASIGLDTSSILLSEALTATFAEREYPGLPFVVLGLESDKIYVPSPRQLIESPEKKRLAWEALKKLKAILPPEA